MTSQQQADLLLAEYHTNRRLNMTLHDWDLNVKPHLNYIEAGAEMAARHARALLCKPAFKTHAQDGLAEARRVLERALNTIKTAEAQYEAKQTEAA